MTVLVKDPATTFIHIPKNAGVAISNWLIGNVHGSYLLSKQHGGKHAKQDRIEKYCKSDQNQIDMGYTFCVVRNPWERVVSAYHYYVKQYKTTNGRLGFCDEEVSWDDFIHREWKDGTWGCVNSPQVTYFKKVDYIIRYENLVKDFITVQNRFNFHKPLYRFNKSEHRDYRFYFADPKLVDEVAKHYHKDIERFGYSFE